MTCHGLRSRDRRASKASKILPCFFFQKKNNLTVLTWKSRLRACPNIWFLIAGFSGLWNGPSAVGKEKYVPVWKLLTAPVAFFMVCQSQHIYFRESFRILKELELFVIFVWKTPKIQ